MPFAALKPFPRSQARPVSGFCYHLRSRSGENHGTGSDAATASEIWETGRKTAAGARGGLAKRRKRETQSARGSCEDFWERDGCPTLCSKEKLEETEARSEPGDWHQ